MRGGSLLQKRFQLRDEWLDWSEAVRRGSGADSQEDW